MTPLPLAQYDEELPGSGDDVRVLDLCSSWVSHFPTDRRWGRVDGLGLNREELSKNPALDFFEVSPPRPCARLFNATPPPPPPPPLNCCCRHRLSRRAVCR